MTKCEFDTMYLGHLPADGSGLCEAQIRTPIALKLSMPIGANSSTKSRIAGYDLGQGHCTAPVAEVVPCAGEVRLLNGSSVAFGTVHTPMLRLIRLVNGDCFLDRATTLPPPDQIASVALHDMNDAKQAPSPVEDSLHRHCIGGDSLIATLDGPIAARDLAAGDMVLTLDHGYCPVRWVARRDVTARAPKDAPVLIRAGAHGCERDMLVAPDHRVLVRDPAAVAVHGSSEILIRAADLIDGVSVIDAPRNPTDYVQVLFDDHEIIFADGLQCESLHPGTLDANARAEIGTTIPDVTSEMPTARTALGPRQLRALRAA